MKYLKNMLFRFAVVLSCICIAVPLFDIIIYGNCYDDIDIMLLQIALLSFLTSFGDLILGDINLNETGHFIRLAVHYVYINILVIGFGCLVGWFDYKEPLQMIVIAGVILFIYLINFIATYIRAVTISKKINEKLSDINGE